MVLQRSCAAVCLTGLLLGAAHAADNSYPSRPVRMIVPFSPGGSGDFMARIIQPKLAGALGQQVVVDNRPGAAGSIGVKMSSEATPDGYTLLLGNVGAMSINPSFERFATVDVFREFRGISQVVDVPGALVVHPSVAARSVRDLVTLLKGKPGQLNYGSSGGSSANRLVMELFLSSTGTRMVHVPYKGGAGQVMTGLLGNEVQTSFSTASSVLDHVRAGRMNILGVVSPLRIPELPNVPTMREQGQPGLTDGSWQGIFVRKSTQDAVAKKLFSAIATAMRDPDSVMRVQKGGATVILSQSPAEFEKLWLEEHARYQKVIKDAGINSE
jgi:tripartite-type tricarboxylate transporter receptor subunit TctC